MMIVDEDEWTKELERLEKDDIVQPQISRVIIERGRGEDNTNVPQPLREVVAEEAIISGDNNSTARTFGISPSSVSAWKHGATSTASYDKNNRVNARERVAQKAERKLIAALNRITSDKLDGVEKVTELSGIAKDMAGIVDKLSPKHDSDKDKPQVHLHVYSPKIKSVSDFEIIDVTE